jgi:hypothetical protein
MRKITTGEQARMVATAVTSFNDLCDIYHWASTTDSLSGEILEGYDSNPTLASPCGFVGADQFRNYRGEIVTIDADAILRTAASISVRDKVVTHNKDFIVDGVTAGRNVTICKLKEIKI